MIMLTEYQHQPGVFDPGHCRDCGRESDLLDHFWQVQREEQAFKETRRWAWRAYRHTGRTLWCSGLGIVLAVLAALTADPRSPGQLRGPGRDPERGRVADQAVPPRRRQRRVTRRQQRRRPASPIDRRSPSGRFLPY
jgi:hypothetical protein